MEIDEDRLRADILENGQFGAVDAEDGRGRTVLTGSNADRAARERLVERLEAAGLAVRVDAVGNVAGRWVPDGADPDAAPVALGSHLDSVRRGGIFDGPLGVYGALEAVGAIQAADATPRRPLEVVSFTEEEGGRFGVGTLGSSVATGAIDVDEALALEDAEGVTLAHRLTDVGFDGEDVIDPAGWDAWLELHVEQGTRLTDAGATVGVVEAIAGITNVSVDVRGETDHAGSTPMAERADALVPAAAFVQAVEEIAREIADAHPSAVATVGQHDVEPNVRNAVPGRVEMTMDLRDVDPGRIDDLVEGCRTALDRIGRDRPVETDFDRYRDDPPRQLAERVVDAAAAVADARAVPATRLHSAAIHDTATVSAVTDAGLLFAPSVGGVSHSPAEWTDWADCARATSVLAGTALRLARGE